MLTVERSFKSVHNSFLSKKLNSFLTEGADSKKIVREYLNKLADQFPPFERSVALRQVPRFLREQNTQVSYLLRSAFGTVWTLELPPKDYSRLRRDLFPSLIAEDLAVTDTESDLKHFKIHTVFGLEELAKLSFEIEKDVSQVYGRPEVYQATAFIEPIRSSLVFVGRTEGVEGSTVWLGGLFLYQSWVGYISEILYESTLGLRSIRQAQSHSFTKSQMAKLLDREIHKLRKDMDQ